MTRAMFVFERFLFVSGEATWNVSLTVRLRGPLEPADLRNALDAVQARYPALRAGVEMFRGRPWFVEAPRPSPIPIIVSARLGDDTWLEQAWRERRRPFPLPDGPLARLFWIKPEPEQGAACELVLVCHHCICDGTSLALIMRALLQSLAEPALRLAPLPELIAIEQLQPARLPPGFVDRLRDHAIVAAARLLLPAARFLPRRNPGPDHLLRWEIDEAIASALDRRSMLERTTITLALSVALLRAFRAVRSGAARNRLMCPLDLRLILPAIGHEQLFPVAEAVTLSLDAPELPFWEQARRLRDSLFESRNRLDPANRIALAERLHAVAGRLVDLQRRGRIKQDTVLSMLGPLELPEGHGPLALQAVLGGFSVMPWRDATGVYATRDKQRMSLILVSREDLLPREAAESIRDQTTAILSAALSEPSRGKAKPGRPRLAPVPADAVTG